MSLSPRQETPLRRGFFCLYVSSESIDEFRRAFDHTSARKGVIRGYARVLRGLPARADIFGISSYAFLRYANQYYLLQHLGSK